MKIGFIGTGLLGLPMAQRLLEKGVELVVWNRTTEKTIPLELAGAVLADTPQQVYEMCECTLLMLSDAVAIRKVVLTDAFKGLQGGHTTIQMGTIGPRESRHLLQDIRAAGGEYLEAPVLGSIPQALDGSLIVMIGSSTEQFERWKPQLEHLGPTFFIGNVGKAAALKLAFNNLIGTLTAAFSLSLGLVLKNDIETDVFMQILRNSALYAPTFDKKLENMLTGNFENPNFSIKHLYKDMGLAVTAAQNVGINAAVAEGVQKILQKTVRAGLAEADYSALFKSIVPDPN